MSLTPLTALSPVDGRYAAALRGAARRSSARRGLIRARVRVEVALAAGACGRAPASPRLQGIAPRRPRAPRSGSRDDFSDADAAAVKAIERETNHDVKAVEYFVKQTPRRRTPAWQPRARVRALRLHLRGHQQPGVRTACAARRATQVLLPRPRRPARALALRWRMRTPTTR